jgi:hypothetical protein
MVGGSDLSANRLSGTLPSSLGNLTNLTTLYATYFAHTKSGRTTQAMKMLERI